LKREEVFARDGYRCVYCGTVFPAEQLSVDHLQARVRGGDRSGGNLVTACEGCNVKKGHRSLAEFLLSDAEALANFRRYAVHAWARHWRAIDEALKGRQ